VLPVLSAQRCVGEARSRLFENEAADAFGEAAKGDAQQPVVGLAGSWKGQAPFGARSHLTERMPECVGPIAAPFGMAILVSDGALCQAQHGLHGAFRSEVFEHVLKPYPRGHFSFCTPPPVPGDDFVLGGR